METARHHLTPVETPSDPSAIRAAVAAEFERAASERLASQRRAFLAAQLLGRFMPEQTREALTILGADDHRAAQLVADASRLATQAGAV